MKLYRFWWVGSLPLPPSTPWIETYGYDVADVEFELARIADFSMVPHLTYIHQDLYTSIGVPIGPSLDATWQHAAVCIFNPVLKVCALFLHLFIILNDDAGWHKNSFGISGEIWQIFILTIEYSSSNHLTRYTGWAIKNGSHCFNLTCSHDRKTSNFKTTFIFYHTELSFEVYDSFLGQLA